MLLIPAIDLKDGRCVRLRQGDMSRETVFSEDPVAMAQHWVDLGASRLHVVDLNGARSGRPINEPTVRKIIRAVGDRVAIQLGGGLRDLDMIERYIDDGVAFVVIGTAAVKNPGFLQDACSAFGGHVIVALDARGGKVATDGWSKLTGHDVIDLAHKFQDYGVDSILYTDIGRDGMLTGVNIEATVELARSVKMPVIASGGIGGLEDIDRLCAVEGDGIEAAILGRALYEGQLDFKAALARAAELAAAEAGADGAGAAAG